MKRIITTFVKLTAMVAGVLIFLVALRRIFIDCLELLRIARESFFKGGYIPDKYRKQHERALAELTQPLKRGGLPLGVQRLHQWWSPKSKRSLNLTVALRERRPHMLVLGVAAMGKTRYLADLITHDIQSGDRAVVVIDADGDLVDIITRWMSAQQDGHELAERTLLLEPGRPNGTLSYNPIEVSAGSNLQAAATRMVYAFQSIFGEPPGSQSQWNAQTANILRNCVLLLMANKKSLSDLPTLLQDNDFRDTLLGALEQRKCESVEFPTILDTWSQYKRLARTDQWITWVEPILNRLGPALGDPRIRSILTAPNSDLDLRDIIARKQILLVKLDESKLGCNAVLLGSLIANGLRDGIVASSNSEKNRVTLYLNNLDTFLQAESFASITSTSNHVNLDVIGAIRTLQGLSERFANELMIGVGTMVCFALLEKDASLLGPQMFRVSSGQGLRDLFAPPREPRFDLIADEEKLGIDRLIHQGQCECFCYQVGTVAGVFQLKSHVFDDPSDVQINHKLLDTIRNNGRLDRVDGQAS